VPLELAGERLQPQVQPPGDRQARAGEGGEAAGRQAAPEGDDAGRPAAPRAEQKTQFDGYADERHRAGESEARR
jgi:hypothetical protein